MLERYLVDQCAPTLAGMKTGSLFTIHGKDPERIHSEIRRINRTLSGKGLLLLPLHSTSAFCLLYLYRPKQLDQDLKQPKCTKLLRKCGYSSLRTTTCLVHLIRRLREGSGFPHEIGLFLGYPPEDVQGFMEDPHCPSKCRGCTGGCWKVYHEPEKAQVLFEKYASCTRSYQKRLLCGASIEQLAVAG
ncbi:MAG: DUF3793 family protein [Clostridiales bacterium]|nr:DUF3793 family protein [Clostridiales bacterium]